MRIAVWGLGYVGSVTAACFAKLGHDVVGIEPNEAKVAALNAGRTAILEPGLDALTGEGVATGRLRATTDGGPFIGWADVSLICVGTPSLADGSANLEYLRRVAAQIGAGLAADPTHYHVITVRSTVFPGVIEDVLLPILERESGLTVGRDFGVVANPEFLRESTAISDFFAPPYTVLGEYDSRAGDVVAALYKDVAAPLHRVSMGEASLLKMANNAFHALKIGFANEIGRLSAQAGLDPQHVMALVAADTKLNISPAYLRPGYAFGGSCLPKDLRSLVTNARRMDVTLPILESILPSNQAHIDYARRRIHELNARRVAILGLSFKAGTDDLRESPVIDLIRDLWRDGVDVLVYDPDVHPENMLGANKAYLERQLPQINQILCTTPEAVLEAAEVVILTKNHPDFAHILEQIAEDLAVPLLNLAVLGKIEDRQTAFNDVRGS